MLLAQAAIDVGKDYSILQPILTVVATAAASVVTGLALMAMAWIKKKLNLSDSEAALVGLQTDAAHRDSLQAALTNAAGMALNMLGNKLDGKTIDVRNEAVASAIDHVMRSAPDAVRYFNLENKPMEIAARIVAKLPQVANTATPPA